MRNLMVALLIGLALVSCKEKALVEETVVITDSVEISKRMDAFSLAYEQNRFKLYKTAKCDSTFNDIKAQLGLIEVVQIPSRKYPGEFSDSVFTNPFKMNLGVKKIEIVEVKNVKGEVQYYTSYKVFYDTWDENGFVGLSEWFFTNPKEISDAFLTQ